MGDAKTIETKAVDNRENKTTKLVESFLSTVKELENQTGKQFQLCLSEIGNGKRRLIYSVDHHAPFTIKMDDPKYSKLNGVYANKVAICNKITQLIEEELGSLKCLECGKSNVKTSRS